MGGDRHQQHVLQHLNFFSVARTTYEAFTHCCSIMYVSRYLPSSQLARGVYATPYIVHALLLQDLLPKFGLDADHILYVYKVLKIYSS